MNDKSNRKQAEDRTQEINKMIEKRELTNQALKKILKSLETTNKNK